MSQNVAPQRYTIPEGAIRLFSVSFADRLDSGELLTGTPTVTEKTTTDLSITSVSVNSSTLTINGETVSAGQAVQFKVSGQKASTGSYRLIITVTTTSTPAQADKCAVDFNTESL